jgi:hypothetical protein
MAADWREQWENAAGEDRKRLDELPVDLLLADVDAGRYGDYYNIWYSIAGRATLDQGGWILFDVLNRRIDYLFRYHAAAALLQLLGETRLKAVDLSGDRPEREDNLRLIESRLRQKIGERPPKSADDSLPQRLPRARSVLRRLFGKER